MVDKLHIKDKEIVVPGDLLAEGMSFLPSGKAYRANEKLFASTVGLVNIKGKVIKVIPLSGAYIPRAGDDVIGIVKSMGHSGWAIDVGGPFNADLNIGEASMRYIDLNKTDLADIYDVNDWLLASIKQVTTTGFVKLTTKDSKYHRLDNGNIIKISPTKIPRIIGKKGSMIAMIKELTDCKIFVGQNGLVWIDGTPDMVALVSKIVKTVERESHTSGLTTRVKDILEKATKRKVPAALLRTKETESKQASNLSSAELKTATASIDSGKTDTDEKTVKKTAGTIKKTTGGND